LWQLVEMSVENAAQIRDNLKVDRLTCRRKWRPAAFRRRRLRRRPRCRVCQSVSRRDVVTVSMQHDDERTHGRLRRGARPLVRGRVRPRPTSDAKWSASNAAAEAPRRRPGQARATCPRADLRVDTPTMRRLSKHSAGPINDRRARPTETDRPRDITCYRHHARVPAAKSQLRLLPFSTTLSLSLYPAFLSADQGLAVRRYPADLGYRQRRRRVSTSRSSTSPIQLI